MTIYNTAEGGVNGATPTVTDASGLDTNWDVIATGAGDSIFQYSTAAFMHGSLAYQLATRTTGAALNLVWDQGSIGQLSVFHRFYFMVSATPASDTNLCVCASHNGSFSGGSLIITSAGPGALKIRNSSGTTAYTFTNKPTGGTWYRAEPSVVCDGTTATVWQVRLYVGDSTSVLEDSGAITVTNSVGVPNLDRITFGHTGSAANVPTSTGFQYYDDLAAFGTTWLGPSASSPGTNPPAAINTSSAPAPRVGAATGKTMSPASAVSVPKASTFDVDISLGPTVAAVSTSVGPAPNSTSSDATVTPQPALSTASIPVPAVSAASPGVATVSSPAAVTTSNASPPMVLLSTPGSSVYGGVFLGDLALYPNTATVDDAPVYQPQVSDVLVFAGTVDDVPGT